MNGPIIALLVGAFFLAAGTGAQAQKPRDPVAWGMSCLANSKDGCGAVFGWCDAVWGQPRRQACREQIHANWDGLLNAKWKGVAAVVRDFDARNGLDDTPPLIESLRAEQRAWIALRDATCGWNRAFVDSGEVLTREELRLACLSTMTRERIFYLHEMSRDLRTRH